MESVLAALVGLFSFITFLLFQAQGIVGGDSGDLVTAAATFGVAHPPGYPLYTFFGWIASQLSLFTPAWRVGLLSSLPHAIAVGCVYLLVSSLTKRKFIGLFSAVLLLGNYLFFLYSVTPEVFGLFDLFVIILVYLLIRRSSLSLIAFVFGLALTHHHMILFLVPAAIYRLWGNRVRLSTVWWFLAGLVPYAYVFVAARGHSIINWDRPVDMSGFIRLVTRADYGTFMSGAGAGLQLSQRLLQIQAYAQLIVLDFTWVGILLMSLGCFSLWKRDRRLCSFFVLALLFLGPLFFFYASFPLVSRFTLGTYERFLLPSYVLFVVVAGIGLGEIASGKYFRARPVVLIVASVIIFLYPVSQLGVTFWRFYGLPADRTADNLGLDILSPLPAGSILFLSRDSTLFSTQYMRYALSFRPDIVALHVNRLQSPDYQMTLKGIFPDLTFQGTGDATMNLVTTQRSKRRIFSNTPLSVGSGWYWVPYGLTYELVDEKEQPSPSAMYEENLAMWKTMHDPTSGILSRYNHLMLSDVRDVYAGSRIALGTALMRAGMLDEAYDQFSAAVSVAGDGELANAYTYEGVTRLFQKKCTEALAAFESAKKVSLVPDSTITYYEARTYRDCIGDTIRAQELFDAYDAASGKTQTPLEKL